MNDLARKPANRMFPGVFDCRIKDVFAFPIYNERDQIIDVVSILHDGSKGYSHIYKELMGDQLEIAREMMKELKRNPGFRIVNIPNRILLN